LLKFFPAPQTSSKEDLKTRFAEAFGPLPTLYKEDPPSLSKPHPSTTPLVRFKSQGRHSATSATPAAQTICQARCEVSSIETNRPAAHLVVGAKSRGLAIIGCGGWKERDPQLAVLLLRDEDPDDEDDLEPPIDFAVGLRSTGHHGAVDDDRNLVFMADDERIKSYSWTDKLPVHTLKSDGFEGPIVITSDGSRIIRSGKNQAAVWKIDDLETHGESGEDRIGKGRISIEDTWRDEPGENIERSTGSKPHSTIEFQYGDTGLKGVPRVWHLRPGTSQVLSGFVSSSRCALLDLESGKVASQYLGHSEEISHFSTSPGDPSLFLTTAQDALVRLYDYRHPLPVLSIDMASDERITAAVLCHPDSTPLVFTGGTRSEQICLWDLRAKSIVYELATGNNIVESLAWDAEYHTLYALTDCTNQTRMGDHMGYRKYRDPSKKAKSARDNADKMDEDDDSGEEEDFDDDDDEEQCWPEKAAHDEGYFGYDFDCGEPRLLRYKFKADADPTEVPIYGNATLERDSWY